MNRRQFLTRALASVPVIVAGEQLIELLTPKRTIFLPPRGVWRAFWLYPSNDRGFDEIDMFEEFASTGNYSPNPAFGVLDAKARAWDSRYFPLSLTGSILKA